MKGRLRFIESCAASVALMKIAVSIFVAFVRLLDFPRKLYETLKTLCNGQKVLYFVHEMTTGSYDDN